MPLRLSDVRARVVVIVIELVFASFAHRVSAQATPARFVVRGPIQAVLERRIQGQVSDLEWQSVRVDTAEPLHILRDALTLASANEARAVIWVDESEDSVTLYVCDAVNWTLFSRTFDLGTARRSVAYEEVAVVVRTSLVALAVGVGVGEALEAEEAVIVAGDPATSSEAAVDVPVQEVVVVPPEPQPEPQPEPEPHLDPADAVPEPTRSGPRLRFEGALGASIAVDGVTTPGPYGPALRIGVRIGRWLVSLGTFVAPKSAREIDGVRLELRRFDADTSVAFELFRHRRVAFALAARSGVAVIHRSSSASSSTGLQSTASSRYALFLLGAEARLFVGLDATRERMGLVLTLGADATVPQVRYAITGGPDLFGSSFAVQPRLGVAFELHTGWSGP